LIPHLKRSVRQDCGAIFSVERKREEESMSVSNDSTGISTNVDGRALLSSTFLKFCAKVRINDPSIMPEAGKPFKIRRMPESEGIELADALLENTSVTYIQLEMEEFTKSSTEAMAKYMRASKHLQRIHWDVESGADYRFGSRHREEILCCFLPAIQESTSLKELHINFPVTGGPSHLALENVLTHTQSLRSLSLIYPDGLLEDIAVASDRSGLKKNTTLRELTLEFSRGATICPPPAHSYGRHNVSPILTSLRDHPCLRRLCLRGHAMDLSGLETLLLSDNSKLTELEIEPFRGSPPIVGMTHVLQALVGHSGLTTLGLRRCPLDRDNARLLRVALCNIPSLHSLALSERTLGSAGGLAELAPALYCNTSIKVLDISDNNWNDMKSAGLLRDILRSNKTMTTIDLSVNRFGQTTGAFDCIADGLGSNSTLLNVGLSSCHLADGHVSTLARNIGSRNTMLQKLTLGNNPMGVGALLETMEQNSNHITDLDLQCNLIGDEEASLVARALGNNALANLTRLSLSICGISDDGFIALVSALEQNTSLLHLDLSYNNGLSERAFLALAESLPEIKTLQQVDLSWCTGLASAMPLLLAGLRKNTSLFRFHVANCAPSSVPPTPAETAKCAGGWMPEMERMGYRNRFLSLIRDPTERLPPRGIWPHALARIATLPHIIFEVLGSQPKLVLSEDTEG
jgi:Ran GTPase-activating protein (RanGAP) involved in mRNA processing and transport